MTMPVWVLASNNTHKLAEFRKMLDGRVQLLSLSDIQCSANPDETEDTFEGNALIKARAVAAFTGYPVIADDSGLEVEALDGKPGVLSARFAGEGAGDRANLDKLLVDLGNEENREARFVACLCLIGADTQPLFFTGICNGNIALQPSGNGGFGYDPVFVPDGYNLTFAELGEDVKNQISHRAMALQQLRLALPWLLSDDK